MAGRPSRKLDALAENAEGKMETSLPQTPLEIVRENFKKIRFKEEGMAVLKDFYVELCAGERELGEYIARVEQEEAFQKCGICGNTIRLHPMGRVPGFDRKTGLAIQRLCCSRTCFDKAQQEFELNQRKNIEMREGAKYAGT